MRLDCQKHITYGDYMTLRWTVVVGFELTPVSLIYYSSSFLASPLTHAVIRECNDELLVQNSAQAQNVSS